MANFSNFIDDFLNKGIKDINESIKTVISKVESNKPDVVLVNIVEMGNGFRIEVAAPGFAKENFKLSIDNGTITIRGEQTPSTTKGEQYLRQEFAIANFERSFNLPNTVDANKIEAAYREGVLHVTLGKKDEFVQQSGININVQ